MVNRITVRLNNTFGIWMRRWVIVEVAYDRGRHLSLLQSAFEVRERYESRIYWLNSQEPDRDSYEPFDHLADVYDRSAVNQHGNKIIGEKYKRKRIASKLGGKIILLLYRMIRNGYGPGKLFFALSILVFAAVFFSTVGASWYGAVYPTLAAQRTLPPTLIGTVQGQCLAGTFGPPARGEIETDRGGRGAQIIGLASEREAALPTPYAPSEPRGLLAQFGIIGNIMPDRTPLGYPEFNSLIYSLDVFLPIVDFKQVSHWEISSDLQDCVNDITSFQRAQIVSVQSNAVSDEYAPGLDAFDERGENTAVQPSLVQAETHDLVSTDADLPGAEGTPTQTDAEVETSSGATGQSIAIVAVSELTLDPSSPPAQSSLGEKSISTDDKSSSTGALGEVPSLVTPGERSIPEGLLAMFGAITTIGSLGGWVFTTLLVVNISSFVQRRMGR